MLGSDHVYQYDWGLQTDSGAQAVQGVITLEPSTNVGGGNDPGWIDWYMKENFNGECLSFGYAQAGQENSFGWPRMERGLTYQFARFAQLQQEGKLIVEPLGDTGRWFKEAYATTPASAITAHSAYDDEEKKSVWYCSRHYRINLYADQNGLRVRDLHLFREDQPDPFEETVCTKNEATYESLPLMDGNIFSGNHVIAGAYPVDASGKSFAACDFRFTQNGENSALVDFGSIRFTLMESGMKIIADEDFVLEVRIGKQNRHFPGLVSGDEGELRLRYSGMEYGVRLTAGRFDGVGRLCSEDGILELNVF
jgi:hypothetical protein